MWSGKSTSAWSDEGLSRSAGRSCNAGRSDRAPRSRRNIQPNMRHIARVARVYLERHECTLLVSYATHRCLRTQHRHEKEAERGWTHVVLPTHLLRGKEPQPCNDGILGHFLLLTRPQPQAPNRLTFSNSGTTTSAWSGPSLSRSMSERPNTGSGSPVTHPGLYIDSKDIEHPDRIVAFTMAGRLALRRPNPQRATTLVRHGRLRQRSQSPQLLPPQQDLTTTNQSVPTKNDHRQPPGSGSRRQCHSLLFVPLQFQCQPPWQPNVRHQSGTNKSRTNACRPFTSHGENPPVIGFPDHR